MYIAKDNVNMISSCYDSLSDTQGITRTARKFTFATVVLNCSKNLFGTSFFLIVVYLKLTYDTILIKKQLFLLGKNVFRKGYKDGKTLFFSN